MAPKIVSPANPTQALIALTNAVDRRGQLPLRAGFAYVPTQGAAQTAPYANRRTLGQIAWLVVHHTGSDATARPDINQVAEFQTGPTAQAPFPGFAYTGFIEADGTFEVAWDIEVVTWSQGDNSPYSIGGVGIYNYQGMAVCFSGRDPTPAQQATYVKIKKALETILGRAVPARGHREVCGPGDTECPGDAAEAWIPSLNAH